MTATSEYNGLFSIEKDNLSSLDIEEQLNNSTLQYVTLKTNLSGQHWGLINELIGRHKNQLTLSLSFENERMFANRPTWDNLEFLSDLSNLKQLEIFDPYIANIENVFECLNLEKFILREVNKEVTISIKGISKLNKLKLLSLQTSVEDFTEVNELDQLEVLETCKQKKDFNISGLTNLTDLYLNSSKSQKSDEFLLQFPKLKKLHLYGDFLCNFKFIKGLNQLNQLTISKNKAIQDIKFLMELKQLEVLEFWQVSQINNLPDLSNLTLKVLKLSQMKRLNDISNIVLLKSLEEIEIDTIPEVEYYFWIKLLDELPNLKKFRAVFDNLEEWKSLVKETHKRGIDTHALNNYW
jgi:hypothetical protein